MVSAVAELCSAAARHMQRRSDAADMDWDLSRDFCRNDLETLIANDKPFILSHKLEL